MNVWNFSETLHNDAISFEQQGPDCFHALRRASKEVYSWWTILL